MSQYKDHPVSRLPMAGITSKMADFGSMLMDKKSKQPTMFGWIFLIMLVFILFHFFSGSGPAASPEGARRPDAGRFVNSLHQGAEGLIKEEEHDPQEEEFKAVMDHNNKGVGPLKMPEFDPNKHKDMHQHDHDKAKHMERFGRPAPKDFPVGLLQQPRLQCPDNKIQLIVLVHSRPDGTGERAAIRRTWGMQLPEHFPHIKGDRWRTIFVMGMTETRFDQIAAKENEQYGDILQGQMKESPFENTRKMMMAMKWLNEHMEDCIPKFILKTNDNIFHNMHAIVEWLDLRFAKETGLFTGKLLRRDRPIRSEDDPLHVPESDYASDIFPNIIQGPEYLFSADAFVLMNDARGWVTPIAMEDGFLGLLAEKAKVVPQHNDHFQMLKRPSNICHILKLFFVFKVYPYEHMEIFKKMRLATKNGDCPEADMIDLGRDGEMRRRDINM